MKVIRPHDRCWSALFAAEALELKKRLGEAALEIEHIGSTAIPGLMAKPIIDVLVVARALDEVDARASAMKQRGYEPRGEHGIPGRRYFKKKADISGVGFHVHVFAGGSPHVRRHVEFRDFLLLRPDVARDYSALKQSLADSAGVLADDYAARKADFIERVQRVAQLHFAQEQK